MLLSDVAQGPTQGHGFVMAGMAARTVFVGRPMIQMVNEMHRIGHSCVELAGFPTTRESVDARCCLP